MKPIHYLQSLIAKRRRLHNEEATKTTDFHLRTGVVEDTLARAIAEAHAKADKERTDLRVGFYKRLGEIRTELAEVDNEVATNTLIRRLSAVTPTAPVVKSAPAKVTPAAKPATGKVTKPTPKAKAAAKPETKPEHKATHPENGAAPKPKAKPAQRPGMQSQLIEIMKGSHGPHKVSDLTKELIKRLPGRTVESITNHVSVTLSTQKHVFHKVAGKRGFYTLAHQN